MVKRKPKLALTRLDNGGQTAIRRCRLEETARAAPNFPYDTNPPSRFFPRQFLWQLTLHFCESTCFEEYGKISIPQAVTDLKTAASSLSFPSRGGWQPHSAELGASLHVMVKRKPKWVLTRLDNGDQTAIRRCRLERRRELLLIFLMTRTPYRISLRPFLWQLTTHF
ncbi:hypothetical protein CEXT_437591 [Caerostris extrusa]|uniref:Uncharacterized protein n=1 Tax=Caerostris extrusa TaxID=172846 RepID=A0AAV4U8Z9_CAEEX|nr:hypothetical protein CEXT_437591 [Caerostris extrusa]